MKYYFFYLGVSLVCLSAAFNYFVFQQIFSSVPVWAQVSAAVLIAALMYGMTWVMTNEDKESALIWAICTKMSVATTITAIFLSGAASQNAADTVSAKKFVADTIKTAVEEDQKSQGIWLQANRHTHAANQRLAMDERLDKYVLASEDLEKKRNGIALMASSLDRLPGGIGPWLLGLMSLLLALALDLGQAKCTKIFRTMDREESEDRRPERKPEVARFDMPELKDRTRAGSYDTGTDEGRNHRYSLVLEALRSGEVSPTVRSVKDTFKCRGAVASAYLEAAADDGIIRKRVSVSGKRSYAMVEEAEEGQNESEIA